MNVEEYLSRRVGDQLSLPGSLRHDLSQTEIPPKFRLVEKLNDDRVLYGTVL